MPNIEKVKNTLNLMRNGCKYSRNGKKLYYEAQIAEDALKVIEAQQKHIDELHRGIEALRDAMKGEAKNGRHD